MKYLLTLNLDVTGRVVVDAKNRKEARSIGEKIIEKSDQPKWWEWGCEAVEKINKVTSKKMFKLVKEEQIPNYKNETSTKVLRNY